MNKMLDELRKPFHPSVITWKPGAVKGERALAMPYADLRAYMARLDEVCGDEWEVSYEPWGNDRLICRLTIAGVTRSSTGETTNESEKSEIGGTVAEAQAFKRACAMFGLGRYLYNLPSGWAEFDPATKRFTEKAKARLTGILVQHYRRATEGSGDEQSTQTDASAPVENPFDDSAPYFVRDWHRLTGKAYDFVKWTAELHDTSNGPCTAKQYQYLTGIVDALTKDRHNYALSLLCQAEISGDNMPGRKAAASLLKYLPETITQKDADGKAIKGEDGKAVMVPNPDYRKDFCELITAMAAQPVAA